MINSNLTNQVLRYVQVSSALTKRALDEVQASRLAKKAAADASPAAVSLMLQTETIGAHQKEAAQRKLSSHSETIGLLKSAVQKIAELSKRQKQAGDLGSGVDDDESGVENNKAAAEAKHSLTSPFVGLRTTEKKASDMAILKILDPPSQG